MNPDFDAAARTGSDLAEGMCRGIVVVTALFLLSAIVGIARVARSIRGLVGR